MSSRGLEETSGKSVAISRGNSNKISRETNLSHDKIINASQSIPHPPKVRARSVEGKGIERFNYTQETE